MIGGDLRNPVPPADATRAGTMSAEAFQRDAGESPTDPTAAISTGIASTFVSASVSNVQSSIDSGVTGIGVIRTHCVQHIGPNKLVATLYFHGFGQNAGQFDQTFREQEASWVDPASGRAPLVIAVTEGTTNDWARRVYDWKDALDYAVGAVGASNVYEGGAVCALIGYSAGTAMMRKFACAFPDLVGAYVEVYPVRDLGYTLESFWGTRDQSVRDILDAQIGPRGNGTAAELDEYLARYCPDILAEIAALPGAFPIWIGGDPSDAAQLGGDVQVLVDQLLASNMARSRIRAHPTGILHDEGLATGGTLAFKRNYWPTILRNIRPWNLPTSGSLPIAGYMEARGRWKVWTGPTAPPRTHTAGGRSHAGRLTWSDKSRVFSFLSSTTTNGKLQVLFGADDRAVDFTAGVNQRVNLAESRTITNLTDIDSTVDQWQADTNVTGTTTVTAWQAVAGGKTFTASANHPSLETDGNGRNYIKFITASSQRLTRAGLLWDPRGPFAIILVADTDGNGGIIGEGRGGTLEEDKVFASGNVFSGHYFSATGGEQDGGNGVGGTGNGSAPNVVAYWRDGDTLYGSINGSAPQSSEVVVEWTGTTAVSGSNETAFGASEARNAGVPYEFWSGKLYHVAVFSRALSMADIWSAVAYLTAAYITPP